MSSAQRAAENESTFRELNEGLQQRADELELSGAPTPYLCECDDEKVAVVERRDPRRR